MVNKTLRFLVINPNTSESMTNGLRPVVDTVLSSHPGVECDFFTSPQSNAPGALPSINTSAHAYLSAFYLIPQLQTVLSSDRYDGYLVACYSVHPLVEMISALTRKRRKHAIGIFEASVMMSLGFGKFGIVTTGKVWEEALTRGVNSFLGLEAATVSGSTKFAGVATTGLSATELHEVDTSTVHAQIRSCTAEFVQKHPDVKVLCVGCAGMVGFDDAIREGLSDALGEEDAQAVRIVEGVAAGLEWLISACRLE